MLKAVIFDMDGVIIDSEPMHAKAGVLALKEFDVDISVQYCYGFIGTTTYRMCQQMVHDFDLQNTPEELLKVNLEMKKLLLKTEGYPAIPSITDLIKNLHDNGMKLIIASSSPPEAIEYVMNTLKINEYFEGYVSGSHVKNPKPAPDIFLAAAKKLHLLPEECIVIEDSANGIYAACAANMPCIGFINPNSGKQDLSKASMLVEGFEEVDYPFIRDVYNRYHKIPCTILDTDRLVIRELSMEDFDAIYAFYTEPDTARYLSGFSHNQETEQEKLQAYIHNIYPLYGYGLWGVYLKDSMKLIGRCGIEQSGIDGNAEYEIGYLIGKQYRHKGYGYESSHAVLHHFFNKYSVPRIIAVIDKDNIESIRLAESLGMKYTGDTLRNNRSNFLYAMNRGDLTL